MSNEERDIIDRETEKIIRICTQFICEMKLKSGNKAFTKQQRQHFNVVLELLASYLKAIYKIYNDQKDYRVSRDLENYKFLKLCSEPKAIHYKEDLDLDSIGDPMILVPEDDPVKEEETGLRHRRVYNPSIDDDKQSKLEKLTAEELQVLEIENKQLLNTYKGLTEEVQQIDRHVYDIAKLQEIFTENVAMQNNLIERIAGSVIESTDYVSDANKQIKEATDRNGDSKFVVFFLLVMSFSLLFLDWYYE